MATRKVDKLIVELVLDDAGFAKGIKQSGKHMDGFSSLAKKAMLGVTALGGTYGLIKLGKSFINAARETEKYRITLQSLLGSAEEGTRAFKEMSDFAAKVPFEYREIMKAATMLAGIMDNGVDDIKKYMPMISDIAATYNLTIEQVTNQVIRMYSAGAGAADLFRDKGITTMMGFQMGVKYSTEETQKIMFESWEKTDSKFRGVTDKLAKTWDGIMTMFKDAWFQFRVAVMEAGVFEYIKSGMQRVLEWINKLKQEGKFQEYAEQLGKTLLVVAKALTEIGKIIIKVLPSVKSLVDNIVTLKEKGFFGWLVDPGEGGKQGWLGKLFDKGKVEKQSYTMPTTPGEMYSNIIPTTGRGVIEGIQQAQDRTEEYIYDSWGNIKTKVSSTNGEIVNIVSDANTNIVTITKNSHSKIRKSNSTLLDDVSNRWQKYVERFPTYAESIAGFFMGAVNTMTGSFSTFINDVLTGETKSFKDYWKSFTDSLLRIFSEMVAQMIVKWALLKFGMGGAFDIGAGGGGTESLVGSVASTVAGKAIGSVLGGGGAAGGGSGIGGIATGVGATGATAGGASVLGGGAAAGGGGAAATGGTAATATTGGTAATGGAISAIGTGLAYVGGAAIVGLLAYNLGKKFFGKEDRVTAGDMLAQRGWPQDKISEFMTKWQTAAKGYPIIFTDIPIYQPGMSIDKIRFTVSPSVKDEKMRAQFADLPSAIPGVTYDSGGILGQEILGKKTVGQHYLYKGLIGEGVLTREAVERLGGKSAVDSINQGRTAASNVNLTFNLYGIDRASARDIVRDHVIPELNIYLGNRGKDTI